MLSDSIHFFNSHLSMYTINVLCVCVCGGGGYIMAVILLCYVTFPVNVLMSTYKDFKIDFCGYGILQYRIC